MTDESCFLGIDIGGTSIKAVLYSTKDGPLASLMKPISGRPLVAWNNILEEATSVADGREVFLALTGSGRDMIDTDIGAPSENEIIATARGANYICPGVTHFIEVGGQFSKCIEVSDGAFVRDYAMNELCAGGSGSFLEQQSSRLHIDIEELARLAMTAARGATIAGRCSVFAKSDMIHLQQKGTPAEEIAYGLCLGVARNFVSTVLKGKSLCAPVAFIGGGSLNPGLVRAFREVLELNEEDLVVPNYARYLGALGACLLAVQSNERVSLATLTDGTSHVSQHRDDLTSSSLPSLSVPQGRGPCEEPVGVDNGPVEAFIGVDVGSVSTDLALVAPSGEVLDSVYLPTRGRPIDVLSECLASIRERYGDRLTVLGVGATGSGRHLAASFLGADVIKNEITAQSVSACSFFPDVDTILEIGGQDSKYISVKSGTARDFTMNKICAAGTGSFLEEQAQRLGINIINEFAELALAGKRPRDLGSRCTVFMDSELVSALQNDVPVEDITAGLAYAVARNYLERVVARGAIGHNVVFQGGVASNRAVVAAFEQLLGRTISVHPYNRISGAIGVALLAIEAHKQLPITSFRGFNALNEYTSQSFECKQCSNRCQVNKFIIDDMAVYFGDACERFSELSTQKPQGSALPDLVAQRDALLSEILDSAVASSRGVVGIPRASLFHELLPFWTAFFRRLGYDVVLSSPSSPSILAKGLRKFSTEACLPVKITFGHVLDLVDKEVDFVFLPAVTQLPSCGGENEKAFPCLYSENLPYMVKAAASGSTRLLMPDVGLGESTREALAALTQMAGELGVSMEDIAESFSEAQRTQAQFGQKLRTIGEGILSGDFDRAFVLLGRPYNVFDSFQNLNLARHLRHLNILTIPMGFLPIDGMALDDGWDELLWKFNRDAVRAAQFINQDERLFPVVLSSFGCGPDGFTIKHLDKLFANRPHLFLEFDEHRGEAGLITRLEAFVEEVTAYQNAQTPRQEDAKAKRWFSTSSQKNTVFLPYFADHAHAFAGTFRAAGHRTEVLPPPDKNTERVGQAFCSGRECHPYMLMASDLVALAQSGKARKGDSFFFPAGSHFPCLLSQFRAGYEYIVNELGLDDLAVRTMHSRDIRDFFGLSHGVVLWQGLLAVDFLVKAACEKRSYEISPGETNEVHEANLQTINDGIAEGRLVQAIEQCINRLSDIAITKDVPRPVVGVAGDIYTRANAFSNEDLYVQLEAMGCEVWPSPFIVDLFDFAVRRDLSRHIDNRHIGSVMGSGLIMMLKEFGRARIRRKFTSVLHNLDEPCYEEVLRQATPYVSANADATVLLNVAKMVDFAENGAAGVINAMGLNCMVGTISAAILNALRADHPDVPMVSLVYGETGTVGRRARLEAFVHQVKASYELRENSIKQVVI